MIKNNLELLLFLKISFTRGLLSTWDCLKSFTQDPSQNMKWPLLIAPWTLYSTTYPCNDSACSFDVIQPCASARRTFIGSFIVIVDWSPTWNHTTTKRLVRSPLDTGGGIWLSTMKICYVLLELETTSI